MTAFDYLHAIRFLVSRHEGPMLHRDLFDRALDLGDIDDTALHQAIRQIVESGEMAGSITDGGKVQYIWTGDHVQD